MSSAGKNRRVTCPLPNPALTKYVDGPPSTYVVVSSTGVFSLLNGVGDGADYYQRIGRVINLKDIKLTLAFTKNTYTTSWYGAPDVARVIVFWDKQADATPTSADLLLDVTAAGATSTTNMSGKNINNKERFTILADELYHLPAYYNSATFPYDTPTSPQSPNDNEWTPTMCINLNGLSTRFSGTGSTISSMSSGALYLFVLGSVASASSAWGITVATRLSYFDA